MSNIKKFLLTSRYNKPHGIFLLFFPCIWGIFLNKTNISEEILLCIIFFIGACGMRALGCIWNDYNDKDFDKKVKRTKARPIASGKISVKQSLSYVFTICSLAFLILIQFNFFTVILGLSSMLLAFSYPFMKRITYWPQLFLGITFNWGIIMAWAAVNNNITHEIIILYISAIFWTLGYDTIYGAQDISDDEIIGLKSTSIKFKKKINQFVGTMYSINIILISYLFKNEIGLNFFSLFAIFFTISLFYQVSVFSKKNSQSCLEMFKINNFSGALLLISILMLNN